MATKVIDSTNLGYLISKIKAAFWPKTDVVQISIDSAPTDNSTNLVTSGGVKDALDDKQAVINDLEGIRTGAALGATALQSYTETDPTVPSWAKASSKPTYTASEVGALPDSTVIPSAPGTLNTNNSTAQTASSSESLAGTIKLHKVSKTGSYSDLSNKPTIPSAPGTLNTTASTAQSTSSSEALSGNITLHKVSKTGSYDDLNNKPTIPAAQVQSDWNATSGMGVILNKPTIPTVTLNGAAAAAPSFYAPTTAGTQGYVLTSNGSGAPSWAAASGGAQFFDVTYNSTTAAQIYAAMQAGKTPVLHYNGYVGVLGYYEANASYGFFCVDDYQGRADIFLWYVNSSTWTMRSVSIPQKKVVNGNVPTGGMLPGTVYDFPSLYTDSVSFAINTSVASYSNTDYEWQWMFMTGNTAPTVSWPSGLIWEGENAAPTIKANKIYEISVRKYYGSRNYLACYKEYSYE